MKKRIGIVVIIELILLLSVSLYFGFQNRKMLILESDDMTLVRLQANGDIIEEESCYYDESYDAQDLYIESSTFTLNPGIYRISLSIETNQDGYDGDCISQILSTHEGSTATDSGKQRVCVENNYTYYAMVSRSEDEVRVRTQMNQDGFEPYLLLREICVSYSPLRSIVYWSVRFIVACALINLCLLFYVKRNEVEEKTKLVIIALLGIWLLSSVSVFVPYLVRGHDIRFHLMRIEGLKEGLLSGAFPVKVQPTWLNENGYPVSILYPDLFLYFPAFLSILGCSLQVAYKIYILFVNGVTVIFSYWGFHQISGRRAWGILGSFVYTLSIYRLTNLYTRAAVGEYTAMAFMPLILYAIWRIYKEDSSSKSYQSYWVLLTFALTGIIQSHIISVEMVGIFIILVCLILWKKTFVKKRFWVLCKALLGTVLLNLWFLIPFFDYYNEDLIVLSGKNGISFIQDKGIYIPQLFSLVYHSMGNGSQAGMQQEMPMTVGIGGTLVLAVCFWRIVIKNRKVGKEIKLSLCLAIIGIYLATVYFPYDFLVSNIPVVGILLANIQFPFRFLALVSVFLTWLTCLIVKESKWNHWILLFCAVTGLQAMFYVGDILNETEIFKVKGNADISSFDISGAEYVPYGTDFEKLDRQLSVGEQINVKSFSRNYNRIVVDLNNTSTQNSIIQVPLLYYRGYTAKDKNAGIRLSVTKGDNNRVQVMIPASFSGEITVAFEEPWYWRLSEIVSFIFGAVMIVYIWLEKSRK